MEEILKIVEKLSRCNGDCKLIILFYKKISEFKQVDKNESGYLSEYVIPKINDLCIKGTVQRDLLNLSLIGCHNFDLLQRFLSYTESDIDIDLDNIAKLYDYCLYKNNHWFEQIISSGRISVNRTINGIVDLQLIYVTNFHVLNLDCVEQLLAQLDQTDVLPLWNNYFKIICYFIKVVDCYKTELQKFKVDELFSHFQENSTMETLSNYVDLKNSKLDYTLELIKEEECIFNVYNAQSSQFKAFIIMGNVYNCITKMTNLDIINTVENIKKELMNLSDSSLQLELLEDMFAAIFTETSHLRMTTLSSAYICEEKEIRLILYLVKTVLEEIKVRRGTQKNILEYDRLLNLNKIVTDAAWRMELIRDVKVSCKCEQFLLKYMVSMPESLIQMCLRRSDFTRAFQVVKIFDLKEQHLINIIKFSRNLIDLREDLRKAFKIKNFQRVNPKLITNMDVAVGKIVENFFNKNPSKVNNDVGIQNIIKKYSFFKHFLDENEVFMNMLDLAITLPQSTENCEIMLKLAYEKNSLDCNVISNYLNFCRKLFELYEETGKEKKMSIVEMLITPEYHIDSNKYIQEEEFNRTLIQAYNEVNDDLRLTEAGFFNSNHPSHKSYLKMSKICEERSETDLLEQIRYLSKLYNYLKAFSRILYIEQNTSDIVSNGNNMSYFSLLKFNRSELMGKLLFERNLDPSEFEKYFGKLKLDYLYHVVGNCFPTINLHIHENVTKEELYPENSLYVPTKGIIKYIQKRNWLLAYILNEMYIVNGITIDISEIRVSVFTNYVNLSKISRLKQLYNGNMMITAMQNEINVQKISDFINAKILKQETLTFSHYSQNSNDSFETGEELQEDMIHFINWKDIFHLIICLPEEQIRKNRLMLSMMDTVLVNLIQDGLALEYYQPIYLIDDRDIRINIMLDHMKKWEGDFSMNVIRSEISRFDGLQDGKLVELKMWLLHIDLSKKLMPILEVSSWYTAFKMCENNKDIVISKLLEGIEINLLLDFIDLHTPSEVLLKEVNEKYFLKIFENMTSLSVIKYLLDALPFEQSMRICYNLMNTLKKIEQLRFIVNYLISNVNDASLKNVEISLKILTSFTPTEQGQLLCLIYDPLSMIEILIMNTKLDKLTTVLNILKSELSHTEFNEEMISVEKIDEVLRTYAEKSLDFRIITQPNPRLLKTPECKLMQSLDSLNLGSESRNFIMPDKVPTKEEWVPNNEVIECMCCQRSLFSMFNRRHHCRRCGRVVCYSCSLQRMLVPTYGDFLVRVCLECYHQTTGESKTSEFIDSVSNKCVVHDFWLLTIDPTYNKIVREEFSYEHAPSVSLCLSLMKYHSKTVEYPKFLLDQCNVMLKLLQPNQEPIQEIDYFLVIKMLKSLAMAAKMSSIECTLHYGTSLADRILSQADLLNLLAERGCLSLLSVSSTYSQGPYIDASVLRRLRDKLLEKEQWNLALEVSTKAGLDNTGVFAVWGKSCLKAGNLQIAREKIQRCFDKTCYYDNLSDYSVSYDSDNLNRSRNLSKISNLTTSSETKPTKNPPLLDEIIYILESNTKKIDNEVINENNKEMSCSNLNQSVSFNQSESAICILNKLKYLKDISARNYYRSVDFEPKCHFARPPIHNIFFDECIYYLSRYGSHLGLLDFYVKHGDINLALSYIIENHLGTEVFTEIYMKCLKDGIIGILQENISLIDSTLEIWKDYLRYICRHLEKHNMLHSLYQLQQFMGDSIRAAMTCIRFYKENAFHFNDLLNNVHYLQKAEEHLKYGLEQEQWVEVATVPRLTSASVTSFEEKGILNPSLVMKISCKDINKHINTLWRQNEIAEFLSKSEDSDLKPMQILMDFENTTEDTEIAPKASEAKPNIPTLFGTTQEKINLAVLAIVCGKNVDDGFEIALRIIRDFSLKPIRIFCEAGKQLAKKERYDGIAQLVNCIKQSGTQDETLTDMCDEMLTLAVATFTKANVSGTKVEDLIKLISHKVIKISAYIEAKQLKTAYFLAVKYKRMTDIRRILREAELLNQPSIKALCQKVLQSHSQTQTYISKD